MGKFDVSIIMGSDSDLSVMQDCAFEVLDMMGISYEMKILSVHRTPEKAMEYANELKRKNGVKVIVAGAGGADSFTGGICRIGSNGSGNWYSNSYQNIIWCGFFVFDCANAITEFLLQRLRLMGKKCWYIGAFYDCGIGIAVIIP